MPDPNTAEKYRHLTRATLITAVGAVIFFVFDAFFMGAPALATFILLYLAFYLVPVSLFSLRNKPKLRYFGYKAIIYTVMVAASFGFHAWDVSIARARAEGVIEAVDHYHRDKGAYPQSLQQLVPAYLTAVPTPRIGPGVFYYLGAPDDPHLMYADFPPFGRASWSFNDRKWISID